MNEDIRRILENNTQPFHAMPRELQEALVIAFYIDEMPVQWQGIDGKWLNLPDSETIWQTIVYRLTPKPAIPPQYPWHVIDKRFKYAALDSYGHLCLFDRDVAMAGEKSWASWDVACIQSGVLVFERGNLPWQETLQKRPEGEW